MKIQELHRFLLGAVTLTLIGCGDHQAESPLADCPTVGREYSPVALLECANRFISLGPDKAYQILRTESIDNLLPPPSIRDTEQGRTCKFSVNNRKQREDEGRIVLLAAVLYRPDLKGFVMPTFGMPEFEGVPGPSNTTLSVPDASILVFQDEIPFLTVSGFSMAGCPEYSLQFLNVCRKTGDFRKSTYNIPTRREAAEALNKLCERRSWKRTNFFEDQVVRIPETRPGREPVHAGVAKLRPDE